MKLIRGKEDKVMILRNKRKGLKLLVRSDNKMVASCPLDCCLWNTPICSNLIPCAGIGLHGSYHFVRDEG